MCSIMKILHMYIRKYLYLQPKETNLILFLAFLPVLEFDCGVISTCIQHVSIFKLSFFNV